jgi:hypothetical protein
MAVTTRGNRGDGLSLPTASGVAYDNTSSGLAATNVQAGIDELAAAILAAGISGSVATFALLPAPATVPNQYWAVTTSTGVWPFTRASKGIYFSTGSVWIWMAESVQDFTDLTGSVTAAQHGAQTSGTLHAVATTSVNGFMSAADKTIIDNIQTETFINALIWG